MNFTRKVAVCQVPDVREDMAAAIVWIEKFAAQSEAAGIWLICFPECFLQGYLTDKRPAEKYAVNFNNTSDSFLRIESQ